MLIVHSPPGYEGTAPRRPPPSNPDLRHERRLLFHTAQALPVGSPVAAGIVSPSGAWRVREYYFKKQTNITKKFRQLPAGSYQDADTTRILGPHVLRFQSQELAATQPHSRRVNVDSTLLMWGEVGQKILGATRVGIVGLGGVGSILSEFLPRLGVGKLVMIDFDVLREENFNRALGARKKDIGKPKIEYASRLAKESATSDKFRVRRIRGSASEVDGLQAIIACDVIMCAADSAFARQVLDHASYAYLTPVIDGGTTFVVNGETGEVTGKSQVTEAGPDRPCLECTGVYTKEEATLSRESPDMQSPNPYIKLVGG